MSAPVFIVGTQRSGTTLLFQMLDTHPRIYLRNEFWDVYDHLDGKADPAALPALMASHLGLERGYLEPGEVPPEDPFTHLERAFEARARELGKARWGLKDPRLTYYAPRFRERFEEGRFLVIVRDARGVVASYLTRRWNVANAFCGAHLWRREIELQEAFLRRYPESSLAVRYEDLLADPEGELRQVCGFLGEEYTPELLQYHRHEPGTEIHAGNVNITRPLQPSIAEKWRRQLAPGQVALVETLAGEAMRRWGYEPEGEPVHVGAVRRRLYGVHQGVLTTWWWQRRNGFRGVRRRLRRALGVRGGT